MDEITELVARLEREYAALSAQLEARDDAEQKHLAQVAARTGRAKARCEDAIRVKSGAQAGTLALLKRRDEVSAIERRVKGRLWMSLQVTLLMCCLSAGFGSWAVLAHWRRPEVALGQLFCFVATLLFVPRRK